MGYINICLLGDYLEQVLAHQAIDLSLKLAQDKFPNQISFQWIQTSDIQQDVESQFKRYDAVWVVPASPYENTQGVLEAIHFVRTHSIPFLGTCGGYQHALIEYAQNVLGIENAEHAELNPDAINPIITPLSCTLVEKTERVTILENTFLSTLYPQKVFEESYHCSFGFNSDYLSLFQTDHFKFSALNQDGEVRAFELVGDAFFIGTSFQPERAALLGELHPIVEQFILSALKAKSESLFFKQI